MVNAYDFFPHRDSRYYWYIVMKRSCSPLLLSCSHYLVVRGDYCLPFADCHPLWHAEAIARLDHYVGGILELILPIFLVIVLNGAVLVAMSTIRAQAGLR